MRLRILFTLYVALVTLSTYGQGIKFHEANNWLELLNFAKKENKNIFLDAYATWCIPCKKMDAEVYTNISVGDYANKNFIPVKIQFDVTKNDSEYIKKWYDDAKYLLDQFHIEAFPTYLFISPSGELVHKESGYQEVSKFLALLKVANDPNKNYAGQTLKFKTGKLNIENLLLLSIKAKEAHEDSLANKMASQYKKQYVDKSDPKNILQPLMVTFIVQFQHLFSIRDSIIHFMYEKPSMSDSLLKSPGFARVVTDNLITKQEINQIIKPNGKYSASSPNWENIEKKIGRAYDEITAKRLTTNAKIGWYQNTKDWPNIVKYNIEKLDQQGLDTTGMAAVGLNNLSYNVIFLHSTDPYALNKAIGYMEVLLKNNPLNDYWLDTYANLLYKLGHKKEAIKHEKLALAIAKKAKDKDRIAAYQLVIEKMASNRPTWKEY